LEISFARMNQLIGSQHMVAPDRMFRPIGTPTIGLPVPAANGQSPHTWTVVPRHSAGACRYVEYPPPIPGQPRGIGRLPPRVGSTGFFVFLLTVTPQRS
jgi:hypothetical protein